MEKMKDKINFDFYAKVDPEVFTTVMTAVVLTWVEFTKDSHPRYREEKINGCIFWSQMNLERKGALSIRINEFDESNMRELYYRVERTGHSEAIEWLDRFMLSQHPELAVSLGIEAEGYVDER